MPSEKVFFLFFFYFWNIINYKNLWLETAIILGQLYEMSRVPCALPPLCLMEQVQVDTREDPSQVCVSLCPSSSTVTLPGPGWKIRCKPFTLLVNDLLNCPVLSFKNKWAEIHVLFKMSHVAFYICGCRSIIFKKFNTVLSCKYIEAHAKDGFNSLMSESARWQN